MIADLFGGIFMSKQFLFILAAFAILGITSFAFAIDGSAPQRVTAQTPPVPLSTGAENYTPGSQTGGLTLQQIKNLNTIGLADDFLGNYGSQFTSVVYDDSTVIEPTAPSSGTCGTNCGGGGPSDPPPVIEGACGGDVPNGVDCPNGGWASTLQMCATGPTYYCP